MRIINIDKVKPGDVLGKNVYDPYCSLLLSKGAHLTQRYIDKLKVANIACVYIDDEISEGISFDTVISEEMQVKTISTFKRVFDKQKKRNSVSMYEEDLEVIDDVVEDLLCSLMTSKETLYIMTELLGTDMYTYKHSVETAIISMLIARKLGMGVGFIKKIGLGAILHDIGKVKIPDEILNKVGPLTPEEFDIVKEHPRHGYRMLQDNESISSISRQIVMLHHERLDGSGYIFGFEGDKIPVHVRIVSIADMFTAMTAKRAYRQSKSVDETLDILCALSVYEIDGMIYHAMMSVICVYPPGTIVRLTNGIVGIVIRTNESNPTRPVIQVLEGDSKGQEIDLMKELTLFVKESVEDY